MESKVQRDIIRKIEDIWSLEGYKEMRFNQLISSLQTRFSKDNFDYGRVVGYEKEVQSRGNPIMEVVAFRNSLEYVDLFSLEDGEFLEFLDKLYKEGTLSEL